MHSLPDMVDVGESIEETVVREVKEKLD